MSYPKQILTICPKCQTNQSHASTELKHSCNHCKHQYETNPSSSPSLSAIPHFTGADYDRQLETRLDSLTSSPHQHPIAVILPPPSSKQLERRLSNLLSKGNTPPNTNDNVSDDDLQKRLKLIERGNLSNEENINEESLEQRLAKLHGNETSTAATSTNSVNLPVAHPVNNNNKKSFIDDENELESLLSEINDEVRLENAKVTRVNDILSMPPRQRIHTKQSNKSQKPETKIDSADAGKVNDEDVDSYSISETEVKALMEQLQSLPSTPNKLRSHEFLISRANDKNSDDESYDEPDGDDADVDAIVNAAIDEARLDQLKEK